MGFSNNKGRHVLVLCAYAHALLSFIDIIAALYSVKLAPYYNQNLTLNICRRSNNSGAFFTTIGS